MTLETLPRCRQCGRPMRPKRIPKAECPGSVPVGAKGLCHSHYVGYRPKVRKAGGKYEPGRQIRTYHEYQSIVADRRRRGIPPEGLRPDTRLLLPTS